MTRLAIVIVLMLSLTGCLSTLSSTSGPNHPTTFSTGLKSLEKTGDTTTLKTLADDKDESAWSGYSRAVLKIYSAQEKRIKSLQKKNSSLSEENKKLQSDLNKLNQINLELEKR